MTTVPTADIRLLLDLEPVVEAGLNRHLATVKEWFLHEYVPWSRGLGFDGVLGGQAWDPGQSNLPEAVRTSLIVNLLTEDNLPSYHRVIAEHFGRDGAWGTWVHRWTAEEDRHGHVIRDYLLATRTVDPVALERARMVHLATGFELEYRGAAEAIAYVSFQELATRVAHRNTGRLSGDPVCDQLLARVAQDENLHMVFYRDLLDATFDLAPEVLTAGQLTGESPDGDDRTYLKEFDLLQRFPGLRGDLRHEQMFPRGSVTSCSTWIGPALARTGLHHDLLDNLAVQITGRKRFYLARPGSVERAGTLSAKYDAWARLSRVGIAEWPLPTTRRPATTSSPWISNQAMCSTFRHAGGTRSSTSAQASSSADSSAPRCE